MTEHKEFKWVHAWLGAMAAGLGTFTFFLTSDGLSNAIPLLALALILALVIAGFAWWAYRKGQRDLAVGLAVGYGLLTMISGGECTLLSGSGYEGALAGFFIYPLILVAWLLIGGITSVVRGRRRRRKEEEQ
jgi:hypothetical protein